MSFTQFNISAFFLSTALSWALHGQPAPQRSDNLCSELKQAAVENGRDFSSHRPGACMVAIDKGYSFGVDYDPQSLFVSLLVHTQVLDGDASAFWLRLSAFDALAHSALGVRQQVTFDNLNVLVKKASIEVLSGNPKSNMLHGRAEHVTLGVTSDNKSPVIVLMASANVKDIDKMKRKNQNLQTQAGKSNGSASQAPQTKPTRTHAALSNSSIRTTIDDPTPQLERTQRASRETGPRRNWRGALGLALQSFGSAATAYSNAYSASQQPLRKTTRTCYTDFFGASARTICY